MASHQDSLLRPDYYLREDNTLLVQGNRSHVGTLGGKMRRLSQSHKHTGGGQRYIPNQKTEEQEERERSYDDRSREGS